MVVRLEALAEARLMLRPGVTHPKGGDAMTHLRTLLPPLAIGLAIASISVTTLGANVVRQEQPPRPNRAFTSFQERVDAYVALHRKLAMSLPPLGSRDRHATAVSRRYLASAIRAARPHARQGDIFAPDAVAAFRGTIGDTMRAVDFGMLAPLMDENGRLLSGTHPAVHDEFPVFDARELPPLMLASLPQLPDELEFRFVDYDLVLWDVYADLVVDVLPYALTYPRSDLMYR
jgi:hypothetical protein